MIFIDESPLGGAPISDEALLSAYRARGDRQAIGELVKRYETPLYNYLARYTGNPSQAEELFQGTFQRVLERSDQFTEGRRFRPWLYSIATHLAIDAVRRGGKHRSVKLDLPDDDDESSANKLLDLLSDRHPGPLAQLEAEEQRRHVRVAVARLPDELRRIIILAYYQGMTLREIAEASDLPLGTVKSRLHKALLMLNTAWLRGERAGAA